MFRNRLAKLAPWGPLLVVLIGSTAGAGAAMPQVASAYTIAAAQQAAPVQPAAHPAYTYYYLCPYIEGGPDQCVDGADLPVELSYTDDQIADVPVNDPNGGGATVYAGAPFGPWPYDNGLGLDGDEQGSGVFQLRSDIFQGDCLQADYSSRNIYPATCDSHIYAQMFVALTSGGVFEEFVNVGQTDHVHVANQKQAMDVECPKYECVVRDQTDDIGHIDWENWDISDGTAHLVPLNARPAHG
jgi:hypothetical protein